MTGASQEFIWNRMAYAEGLQYQQLAAQQSVREANRHYMLCASLSGGGSKMPWLEVRTLAEMGPAETLV